MNVPSVLVVSRAPLRGGGGGVTWLQLRRGCPRAGSVTVTA